MTVTPEQVRDARKLLRWSLDRLAGEVGISSKSMAQFEQTGQVPIKMDLSALRASLEAAGVIFVEENGEGPGVRLRKARGGQ